MPEEKKSVSSSTLAAKTVERLLRSHGLNSLDFAEDRLKAARNLGEHIEADLWEHVINALKLRL